MEPKFVGLNATSQTIEVAVRPTGEIWKTDFADETIAATASRLKDLEPKLIIMEGTGTYELPVAGVLATVGLPLAIVNPRAVREFARAVGRITRADYTPADLLAHFGELVHPEPKPLPDDVIRKLKDLRTRRDDLQQILVWEKSHFADAPTVLRKDIQRHITFLEQSIAGMSQEFNRTVRLSAAWR